MRLIALSILILAGAIMASAGIIVNAFAFSHEFTRLDTLGYLLTGIGLVMFIIEWWPMPRETSPRAAPTAPRTAH